MPAASAVRPHVRWLIRRDLPEVLECESLSFDRPWREEDFLAALRDRNTIGMVAECGELVAGHMVYELHKTNIELVNFAVHPAFRRKGVGALMVARLARKLSSHRRVALMTHARESNLGWHLFLKGQGFEAVRVLRDYFDDTGESAYRFVLRAKA